MADFGPYAHLTLEEVEDELMFQDVLISSLDRGSDEYAEQLEEIEARKSQLNARRDALSRPAPALMMDGADDLDTSWWHNDAGSQSVPNGSLHLAGTYGYGHGRSNKRSRPESSSLAGHEYPSKRPTPDNSSGTPSPATSNDWADRPSSTSSYGDQARQRYVAQEAAIMRRREEELADQEYARSLSQPTRSSAGPSSHRPGVQTTLSHDGSFRRPPPPVKPEPIAPAYQAPAFGRPSQIQQQRSFPQQSYTVPQAPAAAKSEPRSAQRQVSYRPRPSSNVVDLTASDGDSDNDGVTEIMPTQFTPNRRTLPQPRQTYDNQRPILPPVTYPHLGLHSPTRLPLPMPGAYPSSSSTYGYGTGQHVYGALPMTNGPSYHPRPPPTGQFAGIMRQARAALQDPFAELNHLINGSSARPLQVNDDDDSDIEYGGMRQLQPGGYTGYEDLYQSRYDQILANDPEKTKEEINALLDNIRPDEDVPDELLVRTPESMNVTLHKYQELGLTWLKQCEEGTNKGGILGDDMGLGKTIQMISLLVTRKSTDPRRKTTLIVAPVALLRQWQQEIQTRIKPGRHALTIFMHHGASKKKSFRDLMIYDVVLTTFGSLGAEIKRLEKFHLRQKNDPTARPNQYERCALIDPDAHWYRIILDEAQNIKNRSTQTAKGACALNGTYRWCMTGTPMMNGVDELYSLIRFLQIKPYDRWEKFRIDFSQPLKSGGDEGRSRAMKMLQTLCNKIMLRRTKKSKFKGQPIIILPDRTTEVDNPIFSEDEQNFYSSLQDSAARTFSRYYNAGTVGKSYTAILVLLLRLRQACCHPHLIKDYSIGAAAGVGIEDMIALAKELPEPAIDRIKATEGNFECPICLDACTNPAIFIPCGHATCRECFTTLADPANAAQMAEPDGDGNLSIKCPHCRGKVDPKRITDFSSFKRVHMPETLTAEELAEVKDESNDDDSSDSETEVESDGDDDGADLKDFIVDDDAPVEFEDAGSTKLKKKIKRQVDSDDDEEDGIAGPSNQRTLDFILDSGNDKKKAKKSKKSKKAKGKEKILSLADLKKFASRSASARKKYIKRLRKDFVSSAKIDKTMEILNAIMSDPEGEKVLIFSQWTSLLDLVEVPIDQNGYGYRRYDGSMNARMRADAVDDFKDPRKNVRIMMVSLKAGNAGLNLNVASQVIILDPFWNPYVEEQAIDRAHRIGQLRDVKVHRLLVEGTVEDRILDIQEKKRTLIEQALDESEGKKISRLGVQELAYLFGITRSANETIRYQERTRQ